MIIHGALGREERRRGEESFKKDTTVQILAATDAAGDGINLERAHFMINYDLPWNPKRLEQRIGRIQRIDQTEVCQCVGGLARWVETLNSRPLDEAYADSWDPKGGINRGTRGHAA